MTFITYVDNFAFRSKLFNNLLTEIVEKQILGSHKQQKFNIIQIKDLERKMPRKRYLQQDQDSFFGHYLYDQLIPKTIFIEN